MKILLVEDEPVSRSLLIKSLEKLGHDVLAVDDGMKAWEISQQSDVSLIVTDWLMPNMDGLTLCKKIRSAFNHRYIYIIVLTSKNQKHDLIEVFESGADDYITKPFEVEELKLRVNSAFRIIELTKRLNHEIKHHRAAEEKYHTLVENSTDLIFTLDLEGNFTGVNKAAEYLTGYTKTALLNTNFREYTCKEVHEEIYRAFHGIIHDDKPLQNYPVKALIKDGTEKYFETSVGPVKKGDEIVGFQGSARDVTSRVMTQKALEESENRNRMLVETMKDGLGVQDENGIITFVNDSFCRMLGYSKSELIGKPVAMLHVEENKDEFMKKIARRKKGISESYEIEYRCKDGRSIPTIVSAQPLFDTSKQFKGSIAVITDVSEIKRAVDERNTMESQLIQSEKLASIGQLAAGIAHEINNPTGFVSSNLSTLSNYIRDIKKLITEYRKLMLELERIKDNEGFAEYLKPIKHIKTMETDADIDFILNDVSNLIEESCEGTERIKKIIRDLKDFAHPGEEQSKYMDINECIKSTLNIVWNELKYKAKVIKDYGNLPEVNCYPQQLNQVFANLLVNAAHAIDTDGEIKIATHALNGCVEVVISDTGSGIAKENISKIFEPFFTTKEVGKGTGLGLHVAYNIIKKHGGTIDLESTGGEGTTFKIKIPVRGIDENQLSL